MKFLRKDSFFGWWHIKGKVCRICSTVLWILQAGMFKFSNDFLVCGKGNFYLQERVSPFIIISLSSQWSNPEKVLHLLSHPALGYCAMFLMKGTCHTLSIESLKHNKNLRFTLGPTIYKLKMGALTPTIKDVHHCPHPPVVHIPNNDHTHLLKILTQQIFKHQSGNSSYYCWLF